MASQSERIPGKSMLPLSRVNKIIKADKEIPTCAKEAVFLISMATEEFIKRLADAAQQNASRSQRVTVLAKDLATAIRKTDELIFLEGIIGDLATSAVPRKKMKSTKPVTNNEPSVAMAFSQGDAIGTVHSGVEEPMEE